MCGHSERSVAVGAGGGDTESKNPVSTQMAFGPDWKPFSFSTGFFTARRPTTKAHTDAPFRMTSILMRQPWTELNDILRMIGDHLKLINETYEQLLA